MNTRLKVITLTSTSASNSSAVVNVLTDEFGKITLITKGLHSKNAVVKPSYLLPLTVMEVVVDYRQNRNIHFIREAKPIYIHRLMQLNPKKRLVSLFVAEVVHRSMQENQSIKGFFDFFVQWIELFDTTEESGGIYVHWLLAHLVRLLGIEPLLMPGMHWLDLREGKVSLQEPEHQDKLRPEITYQLYLLFNQTEIYAHQLEAGVTKTELLDALLQYLRLHIPGFGIPKSLSVIKDIFH